MRRLLEVRPLPDDLLNLTPNQRVEKLWQSFKGPTITSPWPGPVADLYYGWGGLGRDMNGTTLHTERESWLKRNGWVDSGEQEIGHYLFRVLEGEMGEVREILHPTPRSK